MIKKYILLFTIAAFWLSCGSQTDNRAAIETRKIEVVATTGMVGDAVKNIGGDRVNVISLMGPGVDPHLYKASEGDVTRMSSADIIFYNGLHLEGKMTEIFERMEQRIKTSAIGEAVDKTALSASPAAYGNYDPHIWFDVSLWIQATNAVKNALIELDPTHAKTYEANAATYQKVLAELHQYVKDQANTIPKDRRALVTAHDAFHYFGQAYGFEVRGLQGISTATETGTADVQNLATFIVERQIPAVFVETSIPERYIKALQEAVKAKGFDVKIGGKLFSDAMGNQGTAEGEYVGMVRHNIDTIVAALK